MADDRPRIPREEFLDRIQRIQQAMEGEPGMVKVSARATDGGQVEVRVADDGPGISEQNRRKVFEPFFVLNDLGSSVPPRARGARV